MIEKVHLYSIQISIYGGSFASLKLQVTMTHHANTVLFLLKLRSYEIFLTLSRIAAVMLSERSNLGGSCSAIK